MYLYHDGISGRRKKWQFDTIFRSRSSPFQSGSRELLLYFIVLIAHDKCTFLSAQKQSRCPSACVVQCEWTITYIILCNTQSTTVHEDLQRRSRNRYSNNLFRRKHYLCYVVAFQVKYRPSCKFSLRISAWSI